MWNLVRYGVIVRMLVCYAPCLVARAEVEAGASNNLAPPAQPSPGVTFNNTPEQVRAVSEDALQLLATVGHARVSAPEQVAGVLEELRLESVAHLGRLDQEEWIEMMAEMRGAGVALGDRNKLRLLTADLQRDEAKGLFTAIESLCVRRMQQDGQEESTTAQSNDGVSSDSACAYVKTRTKCLAIRGVLALVGC